jgi:hypothetical protein
VQLRWSGLKAFLVLLKLQQSFRFFRLRALFSSAPLLSFSLSAAFALLEKNLSLTIFRQSRYGWASAK